MKYEKIPEDMPQFGKLIRACPELFMHSEILGIYMATDICSSFLHHADVLSTQTWYENFQFLTRSRDPASADVKARDLYREIQKAAPSIRILEQSGMEFEGGKNFTFIDIVDMPIHKFVERNREKLAGGWFATCGFGPSFEQTKYIVSMVNSGVATPLMIVRDNIFLTLDRQRASYYTERIKAGLPESMYVIERQGPLEIVKVQTGGYFLQVQDES
jgi:hypothetical protein